VSLAVCAIMAVATRESQSDMRTFRGAPSVRGWGRGHETGQNVQIRPLKSIGHTGCGPCGGRRAAPAGRKGGGGPGGQGDALPDTAALHSESLGRPIRLAPTWRTAAWPSWYAPACCEPQQLQHQRPHRGGGHCHCWGFPLLAHLGPRLGEEGVAPRGHHTQGGHRNPMQERRGAVMGGTAALMCP
jgi:hypothetical protein